MEDLPWAGSIFTQCTARMEKGHPSGYWGRCELKKKHECDHALDRGMVSIRWSTNLTRHGVKIFTEDDMVMLRRRITNTIDPMMSGVGVKSEVLRLIQATVDDKEPL